MTYDSTSSALFHLYIFSTTCISAGFSNKLSRFIFLVAWNVEKEREYSGKNFEEVKLRISFQVFCLLYYFLIFCAWGKYLFSMFSCSQMWYHEEFIQYYNIYNQPNLMEVFFVDFCWIEGVQEVQNDNNTWHTCYNPLELHLCPVLSL